MTMSRSEAATSSAGGSSPRPPRPAGDGAPVRPVLPDSAAPGALRASSRRARSSSTAASALTATHAQYQTGPSVTTPATKRPMPPRTSTAAAQITQAL